jgi:hypothetical protein
MAAGFKIKHFYIINVRNISLKALYYSLLYFIPFNDIFQIIYCKLSSVFLIHGVWHNKKASGLDN